MKRAIGNNVEMEDKTNARNDEKRETDETADDRNEVLCGYGQADDEGIGAEKCRHDEFQNEAIGQEESSLLSSIGFIMPWHFGQKFPALMRDDYG